LIGAEIGIKTHCRSAQPMSLMGHFRQIGPLPTLSACPLRSDAEATIEAGVPVSRHKHPGIESAYFLEGGFELPIQGQATRAQ
jgi:hypothetical protein